MTGVTLLFSSKGSAASRLNSARSLDAGSLIVTVSCDLTVFRSRRPWKSQYSLLPPLDVDVAGLSVNSSESNVRERSHIRFRRWSRLQQRRTVADSMSVDHERDRCEMKARAGAWELSADHRLCRSRLGNGTSLSLSWFRRRQRYWWNPPNRPSPVALVLR